MSVIRTFHNQENPYVQLNRMSIRDSKLDLCATGLFAYMFSFKDDWSFNIPDLCDRKKIGKRVVYRALKDLIDYGYSIRYQETQYKNGKRHLGRMEYVMFEVAMPYKKRRELILEFAQSPYFPDDADNMNKNPEIEQNIAYNDCDELSRSEYAQVEHTQNVPLRNNDNESINKGNEINEPALPYSTSEKKEQTSCQQIFAKPETLIDDQAAIAAWLTLQNIENTTSETFNRWAFLYPLEKITSAIDAFQNEIAKGTLPATDHVNFIQIFLDKKNPNENNSLPIKPSKQTTRKKPLNLEQTELVMMIKNQNIEGATYDTITFWACQYQPAKIQSALQAIQNEIKKGTKFKKSQAAFFRACLDGKIIPCDNTIQQNKEFSKKFADNKRWRSLKIHEKYVKDDILGDDLNLYMPHDQFVPALTKLYEKSKLYG